MIETNVIYNEDCIGKNGMCRLPDNSVDMILADLPYGTTQNKWDSIIPLNKLWKQYERVIKNNGAIVLTADSLFTAKLIMSNKEIFRYKLVWNKNNTTGFLNANRMPLRQHEDIVVFYKEMPTYNPQMQKGKERYKGGKKYANNGCYGEYTPTERIKYDTYYPTTIISISNSNQKEKMHPTQKPVKLFEYLIKTYTNKGEIVLDNVMGSGTTAVAALKTGRKFIGFEKEEKYYNIALKRIGKFDKSYYKQLPEEEKPAQLQMF